MSCEFAESVALVCLLCCPACVFDIIYIILVYGTVVLVSGPIVIVTVLRLIG